MSEQPQASAEHLRYFDPADIHRVAARAALMDAQQNALEFPLPGRYRLTEGTNGIWEYHFSIGRKALSGSTEESDRLPAERIAATVYHRCVASGLAGGPGVYLVAAGGFMKIGRAVNINRRLESLQTAMPWDLRLLSVLSVSPSNEGLFHSALRAYRVRSEWFVKSAESLAALAGCMRRASCVV